MQIFPHFLLSTHCRALPASFGDEEKYVQQVQLWPYRATHVQNRANAKKSNTLLSLLAPAHQ